MYLFIPFSKYSVCCTAELPGRCPLFLCHLSQRTRTNGVFAVTLHEATKCVLGSPACVSSPSPLITLTARGNIRFPAYTGCLHTTLILSNNVFSVPLNRVLQYQPSVCMFACACASWDDPRAPLWPRKLILAFTYP